MKGTEIGTRAGCAPLPPEISKGSTPGELLTTSSTCEPRRITNPPRAVSRKKSENEGQGIGSLAL